MTNTHTVNLRKVGGSVMMAVPPELLDEMKVQAGSRLGLIVENGKLIAEPTVNSVLTIDDILAMCDLNAPYPEEDREWNSSGPVGKEIL